MSGLIVWTDCFFFSPFRSEPACFLFFLGFGCGCEREQALTDWILCLASGALSGLLYSFFCCLVANMARSSQCRCRKRLHPFVSAACCTWSLGVCVQIPFWSVSGYINQTWLVLSSGFFFMKEENTPRPLSSVNTCCLLYFANRWLLINLQCTQSPYHHFNVLCQAHGLPRMKEELFSKWRWVPYKTTIAWKYCT